MEKFHYISKKGNFTECEIHYFFQRLGWFGVGVVGSRLCDTYFFKWLHIKAVMKVSYTESKTRVLNHFLN